MGRCCSRCKYARANLSRVKEIVFVDLCVLVLISLSCALFFKLRSLKIKYESWQYCFFGVFNFVFVCVYMRFVGQGCMVFTKCLGKEYENYPLMAAVAFVAAILHACSFPVEREP